MLDTFIDVKDDKNQRYVALVGKNKKVYFSSVSFLCRSRADENRVIFYLSEDISSAECFNSAEQPKEQTLAFIKQIYPDMFVSFLILEEDE